MKNMEKPIAVGIAMYSFDEIYFNERGAKLSRPSTI